MAERKSFLLRLPADTLDAMQRWARDDLRSLNAQIEFVLRRALSRQSRLAPPVEAVADTPESIKMASVRPWVERLIDDLLTAGVADGALDVRNAMRAETDTQRLAQLRQALEGIAAKPVHLPLDAVSVRGMLNVLDDSGPPADDENADDRGPSADVGGGPRPE